MAKIKQFSRNYLRKREKCPNKRCNYNTGRCKCTLDVCH